MESNSWRMSESTRAGVAGPSIARRLTPWSSSLSGVCGARRTSPRPRAKGAFGRRSTELSRGIAEPTSWAGLRRLGRRTSLMPGRRWPRAADSPRGDPAASAQQLTGRRGRETRHSRELGPARPWCGVLALRCRGGRSIRGGPDGRECLGIAKPPRRGRRHAHSDNHRAPPWVRAQPRRGRGQRPGASPASVGEIRHERPPAGHAAHRLPGRLAVAPPCGSAAVIYQFISDDVVERAGQLAHAGDLVAVAASAPPARAGQAHLAPNALTSFAQQPTRSSNQGPTKMIFRDDRLGIELRPGRARRRPTRPERCAHAARPTLRA
jgi:hypothetical protein